MIIYLAELSHTGLGRSPNVVPLAAGYIAATTKKYIPDTEIHIFRDPNHLLQAVRLRKPRIVGFSLHLWSERLSSFCAQRIKEISPKTMIVAGGPSIEDINSELLRFLKLHTYYDICIPNEGEFSFLQLIRHIKTNGRLVPNEIIEGCARLSIDGLLLRGLYTIPDLSDIPSPYLEGFLDTFLNDGYESIIQSMRGCPYACTFCVSGTPLWSKIRAFDLERVFAEFDYIKKRTKSKYLILTDENFGILQERDIKLAEYIIDSFKDNNFPSKLYFYSSKIVTDYVLNIIEMLAPIGEFGISFETLDESVKKEMKRVNISYGQFLKYIQWAKKKKITTSTEMVFGFPGETVGNYINGLERLMRSDVDRIYSYNLRLLSGIDLATQASRDKYKFKTMYRLPERTFGCYDGKIVTEIEEVVVGCRSFDYNDYQKVRKYGLFLELARGRGYLSELIILMIRVGLPGEKLVRFLAEHEFNEYPKLFSLVSDYINRTKKELFETPEKCTEYVHKLISSGMSVPEVKLNFIFTGKIILDKEARDELFEVVKDFIHSCSNTSKQVDFFVEYINNILIKQIISFSANEESVIQSQTKIRLDRIEQNNYDSIDNLLTNDKTLLDFSLPKEAVDFIQVRPLYSIADEATLQDIYMTVVRGGLFRQRKIKDKEYVQSNS